jgi:hypothetical protein
MFDLVLRYMSLMKGVDTWNPIPKVHFCFHLIHRVQEQGNPRAYATWADESLNKTLKACCRNASQLTWEITVLRKMQHVLRRV